jgi:hypothetical protein
MSWEETGSNVGCASVAARPLPNGRGSDWVVVFGASGAARLAR